MVDERAIPDGYDGEPDTALRTLSVGKMPSEREMQARAEAAAKGKVKENGIVRHPHDTWRP